MYVLQTKKESRKSGGAQYFLYDVTPIVNSHLENKRKAPVALVTPYGATEPDFNAVHKDYKLTKGGRLVGANAQHHRIQGRKSIGEAMRKWYRLPEGDFDRIDIRIDTRDDDGFYLTPISVRFFRFRRTRDLKPDQSPLTFTSTHRSTLWIKQLDHIRKTMPAQFRWAFEEISRIVADQEKSRIDERDLLRACGSLSILGMRLGPYLTTGFDCDTEFAFLGYPPYSVPVEVKKNSSGFKYQQDRYGPEKLSRAVILCAK